jgi:hypothetical protein
MDGPDKDQGGPIGMKVHDFAAARAKRPARRATANSNTGGSCKVYEIETARRARSARIPDDVREEMEAAAELYERLLDEGRQIRFDQIRGRIMASLCDLEGNLIHPLTLREAVEFHEDEGPDAAA